MFFIPAAYAQDAAAAQGGGLISFLPIIAIFIIFYFLLIMPQQKKLKEHRKMVEAMKKGDKVITAGGIIGTVNRVEPGEDAITLEIAPDVKIKVVRSTISEIITKPVPAEVNDNKKS